MGLAMVGLLSVEKMLGRGDVFRSKEGGMVEPRLKEAKKLEFWKGLEMGLLMVWPMVDGWWRVGDQMVVSLIHWIEKMFAIRLQTLI